MAEIDKNKEFMVYNQSGSKVTVVTTRGDEYLFDSGSVESPFGIPLKLDEIIGINMKTNVFKIGLLCFAPEDEEEIYKALRIVDWKDILKNSEIEDIILHPTYEGYKKIININNEAYFDRVVGVMTGLKSAFIDIPTKSQIIISHRQSELDERKRKTDIVLEKIIGDDEIADENKKLKEENKIMQTEIDELKEQIKLLLANQKSEKTTTTRRTKTNKSDLGNNS